MEIAQGKERDVLTFYSARLLNNFAIQGRHMRTYTYVFLKNCNIFVYIILNTQQYFPERFLKIKNQCVLFSGMF